MRFWGIAAAAALLSVFAQGPALAAPVEYVKVCSIYGAGFFSIPGTDTCIQVRGGVRAGYGWGHNEFDVTPRFDINTTGGFGGIYGGIQFGLPGTPISIGPTFGANWGSISGTVSNPPASPLFAYKFNTKALYTYEIQGSVKIEQAWGSSLLIGIGGAAARSDGERHVRRRQRHG